MKNFIINAVLIGLTALLTFSITSMYHTPIKKELSSTYIIVKGKPAYMGELINIVSDTDSTQTITIKK